MVAESIAAKTFKIGRVVFEIWQFYNITLWSTNFIMPKMSEKAYSAISLSFITFRWSIVHDKETTWWKLRGRRSKVKVMSRQPRRNCCRAFSTNFYETWLVYRQYFVHLAHEFQVRIPKSRSQSDKLKILLAIATISQDMFNPYPWTFRPTIRLLDRLGSRFRAKADLPVGFPYRFNSSYFSFLFFSTADFLQRFLRHFSTDRDPIWHVDSPWWDKQTEYNLRVEGHRSRSPGHSRWKWAWSNISHSFSIRSFCYLSKQQSYVSRQNAWNFNAVGQRSRSVVRGLNILEKLLFRLFSFNLFQT